MGAQKAVWRETDERARSRRIGFSRAAAESIRALAGHLPDAERALIYDAFELGTPVAQIARRTGQNPRTLTRRVRRITQRLLDPQFRFVAEHRGQWKPTQGTVAQACVIEGLSIREAAARLGLSSHVVRRHKEAIDALYELVSGVKGGKS